MRDLRDHFYRRAKAEHYRARSVYKLMEIDQKFRLIGKGFTVLDIGCAPGSWSQYMLERIGNGMIIGVDVENPVELGDGRFTFVHADILDENAPSRIMNEGRMQGSNPAFNLIVSDAAPKTTGSKFMDAQNSLRLVQAVFKIADQLLQSGGSVAAKVFQGEDVKGFVDSLRGGFGNVDLFKPKSSRSESRELYIIARYRGGKH
jgi:23S rRNA (uridine2552-2'-O)-methyltransferase